MSTRATVVLAAVFSLLSASGRANFSSKPIFFDPQLKGWTAPLRTLAFKVGTGELYYVAGVYLAEPGTLHVICRSRVTLRRFDRQHLSRFLVKLSEALARPVETMARELQLDGVVLTTYCTLLQGATLGLEIYQSSLPAQSFTAVGPIPLRIVERRIEQLPPP